MVAKVSFCSHCHQSFSIDDSAYITSCNDRICTICHKSLFPVSHESLEPNPFETIFQALSLDVESENRLLEKELLSLRPAAYYEQKTKKSKAEADYYLALIYLEGKNGRLTDSSLGITLLTHAIKEYDYTPAYFELSLLYAYGLHVKQNIEQATVYMEIAAAKEEPAANTWLGYYYLKKKKNSSPEERERGIQYLRKAAEKEEPYAQYLLGITYLNSVPQDEKKAISLLEASLAQGNQHAGKTLEDYRSKTMPTGERFKRAISSFFRSS